MNETELLLVGFALVSLSSLSWILGVLVGGRVQRRLSTPRHSDEDDEGDGPDLSVRRVRLEPATDPDRWTAEDGYVDLREDRGRGTDDEDVVDTLERVRSSDEREVDAVTRGFRGEDLNDREVKEWLERFGL